MLPDEIIDKIERYAKERVGQALANANGYSGRARMHQDAAREILTEIAKQIRAKRPEFWGCE